MPGTMKDEVQKGINSPIYTSTSFEFIDEGGYDLSPLPEYAQ
jgi:O-acetylhomoserine/O-acetylserine sulfhydrylase-like pyridoxal-dependent enzyme